MRFGIEREKLPNVYEGFLYAEAVLENKMQVPQAVKQQVARFYKDLKSIEEGTASFYVDWGAGERFLRLVQKFQHAKGNNWKSSYISYEPWQKFLFTYLMSFMDNRTNRRRFRTAYVQIARGQGKSCIASQVALYFLSLDKEVGAEVICASTKKEAARIVLDSARVMAIKNIDFLKSTGCKVLAHHIEHKPTHSVLKAIASDSNNLDGLGPSLIVGDESHQWKRELYDVLDSALTKRDNSLFILITTAGFNVEGIGYELYAYSKKVLSGDVIDNTWFASIYEMDDNDDWQDPEVWKKVNPNWGVSVDPINFEAKAKKAKETPSSQHNFLVKHLNKWQNTLDAFFDMDKWDACADPSIKLSDFEGKSIYGGLDLASKIDLASVGILAKKDDIIYIFDKSYIPETRVIDGKNVMYARFVEEKCLQVMPGEVINFPKIQDEIIELSKTHRLQQVNVDPWSANETIIRLQQAGVNVFEFRMTVANLSEAMKTFDAMIREGKIRHNGSGLLRWCLSNVTAKYDANQNVFPRKNHERLKIDPIVALIMGLAGLLYDQEQKQTSIYESRGLRFL